MNLTHLKQQLQNMAAEAAEIDNRRAESRTPLFDERLFPRRFRQLSPCVSEAKHLVEQLEKEQASGHLSSIRASHLCEKLINQISALQREIATLSVREQEKRFTPKASISISQLYQNLSQHQDWERRLDDMVRDATGALNNCASYQDQQKHQQQLLATEQRLSRCKAARQKIEAKIDYSERRSERKSHRET